MIRTDTQGVSDAMAQRNVFRFLVFSLISSISLGGLLSCAKKETVGRRAGLWTSEHRSDGFLLSRETESGPNRLVQHVPQASSGRACMPDVPFLAPPEGGDTKASIWRVIRVPEANLVVQIQVKKRVEDGLDNVLVTVVRRTPDSLEEHGFQIARTSGSSREKLVSIGGSTHVRLGDCPPEMKPIELPFRAK